MFGWQDLRPGGSFDHQWGDHSTSPTTWWRQSPAAGTLLKNFVTADAACPWDEVDGRVERVSNACCDHTDPTRSCEAQLPASCSIQCAMEAHKFYTECQEFLSTHFAFGEQVKSLEGRCLLGVDLNQLKEAIAEVACI